MCRKWFARTEFRSGPDQVQSGAEQWVGGLGGRAFGQAAGAVQLSGLAGGFGGRNQSADAGRRIGAQTRRALVGGDGAGVAAAAAGAIGGVLEGGGGGFVRSGRCRGQMPGAQVGVLGFGQCGGQGGVGGEALGQCRTLVDGRAQQRMTEPHGLSVAVDESGIGGGLQVRQPCAESVGGAQHRGQIVGARGGGHQQQCPGGGGESGHLAVEGDLESLCQRQRIRPARMARSRCLGGQYGGQLLQRKWITARLGEQPIAHGG